MKKITVFGLFFGLLLSAALASADDTDTLVELDNRWGESEGADALAPMLLDSIIALSADGLGDKTTMLDEAGSREPAIAPYAASDYKVQFLSDDIAVMVHSTPRPEPHWSMHVWQKVDGEWRVAATAGVPVGEE